MKMNPYNMPQIIKETSDGYFHLSVLDDLLSQREIYCLGEIDADSACSSSTLQPRTRKQKSLFI